MFVPAHDASFWSTLVPPMLGFLGFLASAVPWIAKGAKALFSGGKGTQVASTLGGLLGGAAGKASDSRQKQDLLNAQIYRAAMEGALGQGQLDLQQRKFSLEAPGQRVSAVTRGDLLRNVSDFSMGGPGQGSGSERMAGWTNTGGMRPSALGPDAKEAARLMIAQHLEKLQKPEQFADIKYPTTPQLSKPGTMEKILGIGGFAGSLLGGLGGIFGKKPLESNPLPGGVMSMVAPSVTPTNLWGEGGE